MSATVIRMVKGKYKRRRGRGFSPGELKQASISPSCAGTFGIMADLRRSTVHPENVEALKALANGLEQAASNSKAASDGAPDRSRDVAKRQETTNTRRATSKKKPKR